MGLVDWWEFKLHFIRLSHHFLLHFTCTVFAQVRCTMLPPSITPKYQGKEVQATPRAPDHSDLKIDDVLEDIKAILLVSS
jgi:hypothetical protein